MSITLPEEAEKRIQQLKEKYPDPHSAVMPALYIAQEYLETINSDAVDWVSSRIGMEPVKVMEVATFYTMYYKKPVGKFHFQVCRTLSCALRGSGALSKTLSERFGLNPGDVSEDRKWSFEEVECLGSCGTAPMCQINDRYFENLDPEKLEKIIASLEDGAHDLRLSMTKQELGTSLSEYPPSSVYKDS